MFAAKPKTITQQIITGRLMSRRDLIASYTTEPDVIRGCTHFSLSAQYKLSHMYICENKMEQNSNKKKEKKSRFINNSNRVNIRKIN